MLVIISLNIFSATSVSSFPQLLQSHICLAIWYCPTNLTYSVFLHFFSLCARQMVYQSILNSLFTISILLTMCTIFYTYLISCFNSKIYMGFFRTFHYSDKILTISLLYPMYPLNSLTYSLWSFWCSCLLVVNILAICMTVSVDFLFSWLWAHFLPLCISFNT